MRRIGLFSLLAFSLANTFSEWAGAADVYIAPNGNDANPGTREAPFATLERARDALRASTERVGSTVWLRGGTYERSTPLALDERDSGAAEAPVIYRAAEGEAAIISGGRAIPQSAIAPVTDQAILERIISEEARPRLRQVDLRALSITDFGEVRARGFRRPYIPAHLELFDGDEAMRLARWPNDSTVAIGEVLDPGSVPRDGDFSNRGGAFTYNYERPEFWTQARDIWLTGLFAYGYADDTIRVSSVDTGKRTVTMAQPHMYGIMTGRPWNAYYAFNLLEEIDQPGEYYVDRSSGMLYFYPRRPVDDTRLSVSLLEDPLVAMEGASHVRFQDITFEVSRGMGVYIEGGTGNTIAGCTFRNLGIVAVCIGKGIAPDTLYRHEMTGEPVSCQLGSWHEHIYENTAFDREAGTNHGVIGCDIYNIGAGGVSLGGGDRKTLTPAGNYVRNCHIHHVNRLDRSYKAGVNIDGVGNRIEHCLIHDCPNSAIYLHGNDHFIEFNEVHRACLDADDMGVFYMGRDPSEQGNVIQHNFWHDNGNDFGSTTVLYFDDDACGAMVSGNVFFRNQGTPVWINHGCDHEFINNIFVENAGAVPAGTDSRAYDWKTDELQVPRLTVSVNITEPPYAERYPRLLETYNTPMGQGRGNDVWRNVSVRSGEFGGGTNSLKDNLVTDGDPGFRNPAMLSFGLSEDSPIYAEIPGFRPIPIEKIGLYEGDGRRSLPVPPPVFEASADQFVGVTLVRLLAAGETSIIRYTLDGSEPAAQSPAYEGPIVLGRTATIAARAFGPGSPPAQSDVVSRTLERIEALLPMRCKVNFQSGDAPRPEGYLVDTGQLFGVHDGGYAYGWSRDNSDAARHRTGGNDLVRDTLVHFTAGVVWEMAVANGPYEITVTIGDIEYPSTDAVLYVEDVTFCNRLSLEPGSFETIAKQVQVNDGKLTFRSNDAPHGPRLTRLNCVAISAAE